jgi:hypothetical protein
MCLVTFVQGNPEAGDVIPEAGGGVRKLAGQSRAKGSVGVYEWLLTPWCARHDSTDKGFIGSLGFWGKQNRQER